MEKFDTLGNRFVALIIDTLVMLPVGFIVSILAVIVQKNSTFFFLVESIVSVITVFYYIFMHAHYGQTLGKMAMKLKVLDISEQPITLTQSVIRSLPQMFPVFITASLAISTSGSGEIGSDTFSKIATVVLYVWYLGWSLGNIISALVTEKKRALHDFIAGTVVVKTNV